MQVSQPREGVGVQVQLLKLRHLSEGLLRDTYPIQKKILSFFEKCYENSVLQTLNPVETNQN